MKKSYEGNEVLCLEQIAGIACSIMAKFVGFKSINSTLGIIAKNLNIREENAILAL